MTNPMAMFIGKWLADKISERKIKTSPTDSPKLTIKNQHLQKSYENLELDFANGKISEEEYNKRLNNLVNNSY